MYGILLQGPFKLLRVPKLVGVDLPCGGGLEKGDGLARLHALA